MAAADALTALKRVKRELIERHVRPDDWRGLAAVALTLLPIGLLACAAFLASRVSYALTAAQQRRYRHARNIWLAPLAGFLYGVLNPRRSWLKGSAGLLRQLWSKRRLQTGMPLGECIAAFKTPCWSSVQELRQMSWNNLLVLLFSVQHNFEQSHASGSEGWDYNRGAMEGTSFLCLPPWLNWITANIGYHHVHHLSARIPSYCLAECHDEYAGLFRGVTRIRLGQVPAALKYILWDTANQRLVSVAELQRRGA